MVCMSAMDRFIIRLGSYQHNRAHPFPWINEALQLPTKCRCNNLHFHLATTYIFGLQLSTFLFYNKQLKQRNATMPERSWVILV
jgi:hypothetical protein